MLIKMFLALCILVIVLLFKCTSLCRIEKPAHQSPLQPAKDIQEWEKKVGLLMQHLMQLLMQQIEQI